MPLYYTCREEKRDKLKASARSSVIAIHRLTLKLVCTKTNGEKKRSYEPGQALLALAFSKDITHVCIHTG